jgi:cobalt-precorrin 5A hydrolase
MKTAILILSRDGLSLARRIREIHPEATVILGPSCVVGVCGGPVDLSPLPFPTSEPGLLGWVGPLRRVLPSVWMEYDAIVAVMALGIVVRMVGPLAEDKRTDPAVLAVDDAGRFVIPVLGGHGAGANDLAREIATRLGALPVITTANDAHGMPAVDEIGKELG